MKKDLVEAVEVGDVELVAKILDENPSLGRAKSREGSLILTAVFRGHKDVADLLVERFPDLGIHEAAVLGKPNTIDALLESDPALVDAETEDGFTPLGLAAFFGYQDVAETLLLRGAAIDKVMKSVNRNTPLDAAVSANHREVVLLLLKRGAEVSPKAAGGYTPLHKAAFAGNTEMVSLLLEHGADAGAETDEGRTPLDIAVERGHAEAAEALRDHESNS